MNYKFILNVWKIQQPKKNYYFCITTISRVSKRVKDHFFQWPIKKPELEQFVDRYDSERYNIYFCPTPFINPRRKKAYVIGSKLLWADLDPVNPRKCEFKPQIAWKSSDQRYACLWILDDFYPADIIEPRNKAMSYSVGADKGGWDLTQLLRLPGTTNHKYDPPQRVRTLWFKGDDGYNLNDLPEHVYQNLDPREILKDYKGKIKPSTLRLLTAKRATQGKRSDIIWKINNDLAEQGVNAHVRFNLLKGSVWNKFNGRSDEDTQLMREIEKVESVNILSLDDDEEEEPTIVRMSDVEAEKVDWLWYPYLPLGKVSLLEGDPGLGKSWLTMALASYVSNGKKLLGNKKRIKGKTLLMSAEDGLGDTIRPRLDTLEGDVKNIYAYAKPVFLDEDGFAEVEEQIAKIKPTLVIIDPIVAYMGAKVDLFRANETREIMSGLSQIAERYQCAILAVRHLTKGGKDKSIYRGVGSIDITAAARSAMMIGPHPEEINSRCVCHIKSNLAPKGSVIEYSLDAHRKKPFRIEGFCDLSVEDIMNANPDKMVKDSNEDAEKFLVETLKKQSQTEELLYRDAEAVGINRKQLRQAAESLDIRKIKSRGKIRWVLT